MRFPPGMLDPYPPKAPPAKCAHDGSVEALSPEPCPELMPLSDPRASYSPFAVFLEETQAVQRACDAMERRAQRTLRAYPVCGFHSQPVHIYWRLDRANKAIRGAWYCVHCHGGKS